MLSSYVYDDSAWLVTTYDYSDTHREVFAGLCLSYYSSTPSLSHSLSLTVTHTDASVYEHAANPNLSVATLMLLYV